MALITSVNGNFRVDLFRLMIQSILTEAASNVFLFQPSVGTPVGTIAASGSFAFGVASLGFEGGGTELTVTTVGGRYQIAGLTTDGLPNNRTSWDDFGQLCEDVFLGRVPELVGAAALELNQTEQERTLRWMTLAEATTNTVAIDPAGPILLVGTENKIGIDFME